MNSSGTIVVEYTYDAWGYIRATSGSMASTLGRANALRYRGYVYDRETGLYYLQSRYYNPGTGRFINADALISTGQGLLGNNMFAYCLNNPVMNDDPSGQISLGAIAGGALAGALSGAVSYLTGCLLSGSEVNINDLLMSMLVGAVNGAIGVASGALAIGGRIIAAVATGTLSAFNTDGKWYNKLTSFALTGATTFLWSFVNATAINELAEFVTNFVVTGLTSGITDLLTVGINGVLPSEVDVITISPPEKTGTATKKQHTAVAVGVLSLASHVSTEGSNTDEVLFAKKLDESTWDIPFIDHCRCGVGCGSGMLYRTCASTALDFACLDSFDYFLGIPLVVVIPVDTFRLEEVPNHRRRSYYSGFVSETSAAQVAGNQ